MVPTDFRGALQGQEYHDPLRAKPAEVDQDALVESGAADDGVVYDHQAAGARLGRLSFFAYCRSAQPLHNLDTQENSIER